MKKFLIVVLCLALVLSINSVAFAQEITPGSIPAPAINEISPNANLGESQHYLVSPQITNDGTIIAWSNQIQKVAAGTVLCTSETDTNGIVDTISVMYEVQQWNGSSWINYAAGSDSGYNTSIWDGAIQRGVTAGYYYRLVTNHYSYKGGNLVSHTSATSTSIYV
jgi:hypothetical protein